MGQSLKISTVVYVTLFSLSLLQPNTRTSQKNQSENLLIIILNIFQCINIFIVIISLIYLFIVVDGPRQSQASVISIKAAKKSSIHKLETESTDDSDQERNKNKTGNT